MSEITAQQANQIIKQLTRIADSLEHLGKAVQETRHGVSVQVDALTYPQA